MEQKMIHYLNLHQRPFSMIASGVKTIELRLLDEKRKLISIGDTLIFTNTNDETATLSCTVKKLHIFENFEELYRSLPLSKCGYLPDELSTTSSKDMDIYYSAEKQKQYDAIGIEIELNKENSHL